MGQRLRFSNALQIAVALLSFSGAVHAQGVGEDGKIHLNVVVTDTAGKPVSGLKQSNFKLLDNGTERPISSFAAFDGVAVKAEPAPQLIIVIDAVNNGFIESEYIRQGLEKFLRENEGKLAGPTTIARFVPSGIRYLSPATRDGNALAETVNRLGPTTHARGLDDFALSMRALVSLTNKQMKEPGRKLVVWLGAGWPTPPPVGDTFTQIDERNQKANYRAMIQLTRAMQAAQMVLYGGYAGADFFRRDFLKPVNKSSDLDPRALSLDVIAYKSGGRGELSVFTRSGDVTDALEHYAAEANDFYSISFDAPPARDADEFHSIKLTLSRPDLVPHTVIGYYDEPEYFLNAQRAKEEEKEMAQAPAQRQEIVHEPGALTLVRVAELAKLVERAKGLHDKEAAREIGLVRLSERLSSLKLTTLSNLLPGSRSRAALIAVGDASVFLAPPDAEIPSIPEPSLAEQKSILERTVQYLRLALPKLPDFYAKRITTSFEAEWTPEDEKGMHNMGALHRAGEFKATVLYRGGKEVVRQDGPQERGLVTRGTFGPILSTVIVDAAHSNSTTWSRWEIGPNGPMAVFRFRVPEKDSHYDISGGGEFGGMVSTAYHGEIGIDPDSGIILRLTQQADPALGSSIERADIMVEYAEVGIGGKGYTCPVRSVSYSEGMLHTPTTIGTTWARKALRLNDVVFSDYHVFRSEMRIVPEWPPSGRM